MERYKHYLTPKMKEDIQKKKDIAIIKEKILQSKHSHVISKTTLKQVKFVLPEEFSGRDLKKAKKLINKKK